MKMAAFSLILQYLFAIAIGYFIYRLTRAILDFIRVSIHISKIPGPKTVFPFGNVSKFVLAKREDFFDLSQDILNEMGELKASLSRMWVFYMPVVMVTKARAAEIILKSSTEIKKASMYELLRPWLGDGLIISSGRKWQSHRKLLTPSFHLNILENFVPTFNEKSKILVEILNERVDKEEIELYPLLTLCTLDIICATAMGKNINAQRDSECEYVKAIRTLLDIAVLRSLYVWLQVPWIFRFTSVKRENDRCLKIVHDFAAEVIRERQDQFTTEKLRKNHKEAENDDEFGRKKRVALLDTLLKTSDEAEESLSFQELCEEVDTFMFAGHDTTATALFWALVWLGQNPSVQEKAFEEINRICVSSDEIVTYQEISQLKYLECVIKESLRIAPPVTVYGRVLAHDVEIDGYVVPKGVEVFVVPYLIHRDPDYYDNPESFNPERFMNDTEKEKHSFSYVPFSAGPRNCLGQKFALIEEKVLLANLIRHFKIKHSPPLEEIKPSLLLISAPLNQVNFVLEKRKL